jgi:acyl-CoA synthetase (AMP-forming)/AMP-acid ligase II
MSSRHLAFWPEGQAQHLTVAIVAQEIIDWARATMAAYKIPRIVQFVDALPKSSSGKIQWRELQEQEKSAN